MALPLPAAPFGQDRSPLLEWLGICRLLPAILAPMLKAALLTIPLLVGARVHAQAASTLPPVMLTEEIGLAMNKVQVLAAAERIWANTFGLEPGARLLGTDGATGQIAGTARVNYRGRLLAFREETMGGITYAISVQARNGQCIVRLHDFKHVGNRSAPNGGVSLGLLLEGEAPLEHYPHMGLGMSRKLHADARKAALDRAQEVLRLFAARMRSAATE